MNDIQLTKYSHGAGCGCKISPAILDQILATSITYPDQDRLLVGNDTKDDAAVYDLGDSQCLISTTDFFMPIVDDPFTYGKIAAANAISDVYAMGGKPIMAIAILGWPIQILAPGIAKEVISGARSICAEAGIMLAGGHSIDSPEPIFGLSVNGLVKKENIKRNNTAQVGDQLLLTKRIGVGLLTTAEKKGKLKEKDYGIAAAQMVKLNTIGGEISQMDAVHAMTDVTGFGLLGHLLEMVEGSGVSAILAMHKIPLISDTLFSYCAEGCIPGGTKRNHDSYGKRIGWDVSTDRELLIPILCDPQTSGGLLISVGEDGVPEILERFTEAGLIDFIQPLGTIVTEEKAGILVLD